MNRWVAHQRARLAGHEDGSVLVFTALVTAVLLGVGALAVDLGRIAVTSRDQQGATDRAALDTLLALQQRGSAMNAELVADTAGLSLGRNLGFWAGEVDVDTAADDLDVHLRPVACGPAPGEVRSIADGAWGDPDVTGVEVTTTSRVPSLFLPGTTPRTVERRAVACSQPFAAISAAGTTAAIEDGVAGELLSGLTGGALDASLVGWEGLAQTSVGLAELGTELGALGVDVGAGTLSELLDAEVTVGQLGGALVNALQAGGDTAGIDATLLGALGGLDVPALPAFVLGDLLAVSTSAEAALATELDAVGRLVAGLQLANHQAAIAIDLEIGDLTGVRLTVIEPPDIAIGPPGYHGNGEPRTQARSAQLGLDVRLPVGVATTSGTPATVTVDIADRVQPFRDEIDELDGCYTALHEASTSTGTIRQRLEAAIDEVDDAAQAAGLGEVVGGLVGAVDSLLSGLLSGLGCATFLTRQQTLDSIRSDLHELADLYEEILLTLAGHEVAPPEGPESPAALSLRLAQATHTLEAVSCTGDGQTVGRVVGGAASLRSTAWDDTYEPDPAGAVVQLLDVNLGLLRASVGFDVDVPLGESVDEAVLFEGPWSTRHRQGADTAGVDAIVDGLHATASGTHLLGWEVDGLLDGLVGDARELLRPVLADLDDLLVPVLDVLGAELGGVDVATLDSRCTGRSLVR